MKERPILMATESVKAILDGRKTMTRRVVKPCSTATVIVKGVKVEQPDWVFTCAECPHGQIGDRLWVRETTYKRADGIWLYKADDEWIPRSMNYYKRDICPSIFMPRWASRLTLEITEVRVERLQEISHRDAYKEGCKATMDEFQAGCSYIAEDYREHFIRLWDSLNAKRGYGWETNPWVWVLKFDNIGVRVK